MTETFTKEDLQGIKLDCDKDGVGEGLDITNVKFDQEGKIIVGRLMEVKKMFSQKFNTEFYRYIFHNGIKLVSCIPGAMTDNVLSSGAYIGKVIFLKYKGKIDLENGKVAKVFDIKDVTKKCDTMFPTLPNKAVSE